MFEQNTRPPAGIEWVKVRNGEMLTLTFCYPEPCARYDRASIKEEIQPASAAPDEYAVTDVYVVRVRPNGNAEEAPAERPRGELRLLAVERTLRVAIEREAARVRWATMAQRWPERADRWHVGKDKAGAWYARCYPAIEGASRGT